uniref:Uncharacterized protein n=1 Tax=Romanomermis culicivorax TaxID=13658 RepID=A0A915HHS0_ROMCU
MLRGAPNVNAHYLRLLLRRRYSQNWLIISGRRSGRCINVWCRINDGACRRRCSRHLSGVRIVNTRCQSGNDDGWLIRIIGVRQPGAEIFKVEKNFVNSRPKKSALVNIRTSQPHREGARLDRHDILELRSVANASFDNDLLMHEHDAKSQFKKPIINRRNVQEKSESKKAAPRVKNPSFSLISQEDLHTPEVFSGHRDANFVKFLTVQCTELKFTQKIP